MFGEVVSWHRDGFCAVPERGECGLDLVKIKSRRVVKIEICRVSTFQVRQWAIIAVLGNEGNAVVAQLLDNPVHHTRFAACRTASLPVRTTRKPINLTPVDQQGVG